MDIKEYAAGLGLNIDDNDKNDSTLRSEKRYLIIIEIVHNNKKYVISNKKPALDPIKSKDETLKKIKFKLKDKDVLTFRCCEVTFANIPIDNVLVKTRYEMQPISNRWLEPDEIKDLLKTK